MGKHRRFEFMLAGEEEDEALRTLLRTISMPGEITLSFQREPSFFLAEQAGNLASQVVVCKDQQKNQLVGMGSRSIRSVYIDGQPTRVGYLSMLRGIAEVRGSIAFTRGYRYLHTLHADGAVPYYFTTILDDNINARTLLTSGRANLPVYKPLAQLLTYLIPLRKNRSRQRSNSLVSRVDRNQLPEALNFLQNWNSQHQFAPVYTLTDLLGESKLLPGFSWENLSVYQERGKVCGTLGVWDQQFFKQIVVTAYSRKMRYVRTFYNLFAALVGNPGLPALGAEVKLLYATCLSGDANVFKALLHQACVDWSNRGYDYLSVGICGKNQLAATAARYATECIASTVYIVYWPQDAQVSLPGTDKSIHLEVATL
jgi:hypothetical protein